MSADATLADSNQATPQTKAIIAVHLYGLPADMDRLGELSHRRGIHLVEDCAQAHGARYHGQRIGGIGAAAGFSFYPGKNLGAYGDAGAVVTNDEKVATFVRKFANHGRLTKYEHDFVGTNCRLDGMQAAILRVKLRHLDRWNQQRQQAAKLYDKLLAGVPGLTLPTAPNDREHVYHLYAVELDGRENVAAELAKQNIATGVHYPVPLHLQPAYRHLGITKGSLPNTERAAARVLSLPMFPEITTEQVERVCSALRSILGAPSVANVKTSARETTRSTK
jgi:dTDP-4-amino-4,6-dideoxygalactose transaminase